MKFFVRKDYLFRCGRPGFLALLLALVAVAFTLPGCGGPHSKCLLPVEKTGESYLLGMTYLEEKKPELAAGSFKEILACNRKFSPAYSGLAVSYAQIAAAGLNPEGQTVIASLHALELARKYSSGNEDSFRRNVAAMRVFTTYKSVGWLERVESEYKRAMKTRVDRARLPYYLSSDSAAFFMGKAYFDAGRIESALDEYKALSKADRIGKWGVLAERDYKRSTRILSHIERSVASPEVVVLAFHRALTRADLAAILIEELRVDELLDTREVSMETERSISPVPSDVFKSRFRSNILKVVALHIKGLEPSFSGTSSTYLYRPAKVVTRKDFAVIMDDLLKRLSVHGPAPGEGLSEEKPFSDVPQGVPWYTAVMDVTRANIMRPATDRLFKPYDGLDGPDAYTAVISVKEMLGYR